MTKFTWREDESKDAYMYLANGIFFTVRKHSYREFYEAVLWLKTGDNRQIEIHSFEIDNAFTLDGAKKIALRSLKAFFRFMTDGIDENE